MSVRYLLKKLDITSNLASSTLPLDTALMSYC